MCALGRRVVPLVFSLLWGTAARADGPDGPHGGHALKGKASWYGKRHHGRRTASGERFDMHALTAAHPTLPFGTRVRVVVERTSRKVEVVINDRGPFARGRILDLSRAAAERLGILRQGVAAVTIEVVSMPPPRKPVRRKPVRPPTRPPEEPAPMAAGGV